MASHRTTPEEVNSGTALQAKTNSTADNQTLTDSAKEFLRVEDVSDGQTPANLQADISVTNANSLNPHDWPRSKKWLTVAIAAMFTFLSPISSSMVAPALPAMAIDLGLNTTIEVEMTMSIFILAYALGPFIAAPLSEVYGRYKILMVSILVFVLFNLACGFAKTTAQILVFRFLAGLGGSAPIAISGSIITDLFDRSEMGSAMAYYGLGVILAPAIGPIIGGIMTQNTSWHWVFYVVSIITAVVAIFGIVVMPETYRPYLESQARKVAAAKDPLFVTNHRELPMSVILTTAIFRPFILLGTQPIAQVIALYMAFVYGIMYIVLTTYSSLFVLEYGETSQTSSFHYVALGLGFVVGNRLSGSLIDYSSEYLQKRYNTPHMPEYRLPVAIPAALALPIGLFIYGWAAEYNWHWVVVDIGIAIFSCAVIIIFQALTVYTVDVYTLYSASALAAVSFLRSVAGFGFPLFATSMYAQLGYGWGNSVLAFIGLGIGIPAPILLFVYGARIRAKSKFASG
ncbi:hypothetical protein HK100_002492 [Physocladia obscura]|uniref:Major facilitator superfamily (MFS) profile domain-containing protein n=1 Tax=Physocladia obscura TaxID=109957 RepID=A0AAD5XDT7_9FUNG|nr:hypothetical protein HK100_002492 [Physocladia obscura]